MYPARESGNAEVQSTAKKPTLQSKGMYILTYNGEAATFRYISYTAKYRQYEVPVITSRTVSYKPSTPSEESVIESARRVVLLLQPVILAILDGFPRPQLC
jgi:hypothetical protein